MLPAATSPTAGLPLALVTPGVAAGGVAHMAGLALMALILIAGRAVCLCYHQLGRCHRCGGGGTSLFSTKKRHGPCQRCEATKATRRVGSR
jgi:hypothetical protein